MSNYELPIKVKWSGDSRSKYETRTLEPLSSDGNEDADIARKANARQKTQLVIKTEEELESTLKHLKKHADFCGEYGAHWGSPQKQAAAERVIAELKEAKSNLGLDDGSEDGGDCDDVEFEAGDEIEVYGEVTTVDRVEGGFYITSDGGAVSFNSAEPTEDNESTLPTKIKLSGRAREFLTTALYTHVEDGDKHSAGWEVTQRQKTQLVINTEEELEALKYELEYWKDGHAGHPGLNTSMQNALERVYAELLEDRDVA